MKTAQMATQPPAGIGPSVIMHVEQEYGVAAIFDHMARVNSVCSASMVINKAKSDRPRMAQRF
jgi:hypothetical protein